MSSKTVDTADKNGPARARDGAGDASTDAALDGAASESSGSGAASGSGSGSTSKADAGKKSVRDGGIRDAGSQPLDSGRPDECGGVHCAAPTVCDRDAGVARCVCPPGYDFDDLGGTSSPCVPHCDGDCDGG